LVKPCFLDGTEESAGGMAGWDSRHPHGSNNLGDIAFPLAYERPSRLLMALELPRAGLDFTTLGPTWPVLRAAPRGDGHPVLVLPGFGASDVSTRLLRRFLRDHGYHVHPWRLGRNLGPSPVVVSGLRQRVSELAERHGSKMSLVGWSLGGIYAREIAMGVPSLVRQVVTLGSPFRLRDRRASNAGLLFEVIGSGRRRRPQVDPRPLEDERGPMPVPSTSIYTRTDGVIPWRSCLEVPAATSESIEVVGSHSGLGHNPAALWVIADRLAQPDGRWHHFEPRGPIGLLFPSSRNPSL